MTEPTNQRPKLAHELLADAVDLLLNGQRRVIQSPQDLEAQAQEFAQQLQHLEMALRNYRLAASAAASAPFAGIVQGAIAKLQAGDSEAAMKFLLTLVNVTDYSPTIALDQVVQPKPEPEVAEHTPTHVDRLGGRHTYVDDGWHMEDGDQPKLVASAYFRDSSGVLRSTPLARWHRVFKLIE
ncbi:MAG TPA: hypothetical protein VJP88_08625 [Caulobacteraceae bacterium]|nr:hypothetical protein [Caulobacteraceae bacterium]